MSCGDLKISSRVHKYVRVRQEDRILFAKLVVRVTRYENIFLKEQ